MTNLQIHPPTALLFLIDALRSTGKVYRLDLYVDPTSLGSVLTELDSTGEPKELYAENEIQVLLGKFLQALQAEGAAQPEEPPGAQVTASGPALGAASGLEGSLGVAGIP